MFSFRSQPNTRRRALAWLLLLVCAWMGTGGVLHHTEAEGWARAAAPNSAPILYHAAAVPDDACAACEWTQGLQGHAPSVLIVLFLLFLMPIHLAPTLPVFMARTMRHRPSRAPPALPA